MSVCGHELVGAGVQPLSNSNPGNTGALQSSILFDFDLI